MLFALEITGRHAAKIDPPGLLKRMQKGGLGDFHAGGRSASHAVTQCMEGGRHDAFRKFA
jgi:hypothetical protein